jgi:MFS transporter, ACS family, glucarate transporter
MPEQTSDQPQGKPELSLQPVTGQPTNTRWVILGLACFASFLTYVHRYAWGATRPFFKKEYGLTDKDMGWLDGAFNLTYAMGQFPGGWAADIFGPRLMIPLATVMWSLMLIGPALTGLFWWLLASRLGFGATQSPCYPSLGKVTKSWFPLRIRTSMQGLVASFAGRAGAALAPFLIATVMMASMGMSWQGALYLLASIGLFYALGFWMIFRNSPKEHPWANSAEQQLIEQGEVPASEQNTKIQWTRANKRNLFVFMAASFCSTFADNLFVFYMPQFLVEEKGFTLAQMGLFAGLPLLGGALGGMCGGVLNDFLIRVLGDRRKARSIVAASGKTIAAILIASSLLVGDGRMVMFVLFFCKFFSDWSQPTWWGTVTDIGGPASGRVFGMVNTVGSIGATIAGPVMGYVLYYLGWSSLFLFVGAIYILTAILWLFVNCTQRMTEAE